MNRADTYVQVPHLISSDARFAAIYTDDRALAAWLRLYLTADETWPNPAPLPRSVDEDTIEKMVTAGLVAIEAGDRYTIPGLAEHRQASSDHARVAAWARWGNAPGNAPGNAQSMPTKTKTKTKTSFSSSSENANEDENAPRRSITSPLLHSSVTPSRVTGRDMERLPLRNGNDGVEPALDAYQRICPNVSENALRFLDELIASFGQEGTAEAIGQAALDGRDKLLSRAKSILVLRAREADRAEAEDERRRNAAKRAPTPWQLAPAARSDGLVPVAAALPAHIPRPAFMGPEPTVKAKP